ncbi:FtsX-like permease family protein [uncultured Amnibacterium sp.]|uniref:FtsX-like permease family protein n=1 Tax=uncultured Amnibacterium sp. TaxID=1631851 RepID=UPI0035CC179A
MTGALISLAVRFSLQGRDALVRTGLIALATGLAVALLMLAVSVPGALAARDARSNAWRLVSGAAAPSERSLVAGTTSYSVGDVSVTGLVVHPDGQHPSLPAGVTALPGDRQMLVSPALRDALASSDGAPLRAALPYKVVGVVGPAALLGPTDLKYLAVDDRLVVGSGTTDRVVGFGDRPDVPQPLDAVLALLLVVGVLIVLLPVGVVVTIAGRFGAERRDLRLASVRLLGLSRSATTRLALTEALVAAVIGDVVGIAVFAVARQGLGAFSVASLSVFPSDAVPPAPAVALIMVIVPLLAVGSALVSLRATVIEPLGVARRARQRRRRLWWRLVPLVAAGGLLGLSVGRFSADRSGSVPAVAAGVTLLLIGALLLLPWLSERLAGATHGGAVSWQFATGRIRHGGSTTARVVGAVTIVLAGAIALQMLFAGLSGAYTRDAALPQQQGGLVVAALRLSAPTAQELSDRLGRAGAGSRTGAGTGTGTEPAAVITSVTTRTAVDGVGIGLRVGTCADLARLAHLGSCADGDVFTGSAATARVVAGRIVRSIEGHLKWAAPARIRHLQLTSAAKSLGFGTTDLFATPAAVRLASAGPVDVQALVPPDAASQTRDRVIAAAAATVPLISVSPTGYATTTRPYAAIQRGLTVGLVLVLLLIGGVMLVSIGDQLRERRQMLATLSAVGMPRAVMVRSILWESALPVVIGVGLAVVTGVALGGVLLAIVSRDFTVDPSMLAASAAAALAVPLLVTALSLPAATRRMRPDGLRAE